MYILHFKIYILKKLTYLLENIF